MKKTMVILLLVCLGLLPVTLPALSNNPPTNPRISELVKVVCHYAVVDSTDIKSDSVQFDHFVLIDQLDHFMVLQIEADLKNRSTWDETPAHWHYVNRRLVRIKMAPAVLEPSFDNPSVMTLEGAKFNWKTIWSYHKDIDS